MVASSSSKQQARDGILVNLFEGALREKLKCAFVFRFLLKGIQSIREQLTFRIGYLQRLEHGSLDLFLRVISTEWSPKNGHLEWKCARIYKFNGGMPISGRGSGHVTTAIGGVLKVAARLARLPSLSACLSAALAASSKLFLGRAARPCVITCLVLQANASERYPVWYHVWTRNDLVGTGKNHVPTSKKLTIRPPSVKDG
ncbi:hypothetical protein EDD16DRAFT_1520198 [Pisolithus croceorrhizus]|nr:hypothetical protein EDD16DRAFT_1520198 [Pisolithus croceorrhizus]KAI6158484.1 hypothetical protein EDD17DRAFT_1512215 [Pisolithus thermaeus]